MSTMQDVVRGAAKRLGLIRGAEDMDADEAADLLEALNDMLAGWEAKGVNALWSSALDLTATFPLDDKHLEGVKAMLAVRYAETFGKPIGGALNRDARDGWNALYADYGMPDEMQVDRALQNMPSQRRYV